MAGWLFLSLRLYLPFPVYSYFFSMLGIVFNMISVYRFIFTVSILFVSYTAFTPSNSYFSIENLDKILHFIVFLYLAFLLDLSSKYPLNENKKLLLILIFYAGLIEVIQSFLPYRSAEILDFLFDMLGILVYFIFAPRIKLRIKKWDIFS